LLDDECSRHGGIRRWRRLEHNVNRSAEREGEEIVSSLAFASVGGEKKSVLPEDGSHVVGFGGEWGWQEKDAFPVSRGYRSGDQEFPPTGDVHAPRSEDKTPIRQEPGHGIVGGGVDVWTHVFRGCPTTIGKTSAEVEV